MITKWMGAAVLAAALAAGTVIGASAQPSAVAANLSLYGGTGATYPDGSTAQNITMFGAEAHVGGLLGNFGVQGDAWGARDHYVFSGGTSSDAGYGGVGLHINARSPDGLIGGLVSFGATPGGYNAEFLNTAAEAQQSFGAFTLSGQAGYTQTIGRSAPSAFTLSAPQIWYAHAIGRWFATDDFMLAADVGYAAFNDSVAGSGNATRWGARLEYKLKAMPFSAFVAYQGYRWTQPTFEGGNQMLMVGLTFLTGDQSLKSRYRGAAGLDDRNLVYGVNYAP